MQNKILCYTINVFRNNRIVDEFRLAVYLGGKLSAHRDLFFQRHTHLEMTPVLTLRLPIIAGSSFTASACAGLGLEDGDGVGDGDGAGTAELANLGGLG